MVNYFRMDGWVKSAVGPAVPGAQVYVCLQPANLAGLPPTPLANIFSDPNGLVPITQPILTDGFGHYDFYAQAGVYTVAIGLGGVLQQYYPDQSLGGASGSSGGGTGLQLQVNGQPNVNQLLLNLAGQNSVSAVDQGNGTVNITGAVFQTNSVANTLQSLLNLKSGINVTLTADGIGGVTIDAPSNIPQANALWFPSLSNNNWAVVGDNIGSTDSGVSTTFIAPTATTNAAIQHSGHARCTYGTSFVYAGRGFTFKAVVQSFTNDGSSNAQVALGLSDSGASQSATGNPSGNFILFTIPSGASTWYAQTSNGAGTNVNTGITCATRHTLEIDYNGATAVFKIDGVSRATIVNTLPAAATALGMMHLTGNNGTIGSNQILVCEYMSCVTPTV